MDMSVQKRQRHRWKCIECGMINRAYRETCFGRNCTVTESESFLHRKSPPKHDDDGSLIVEFKDENSKVTCRLDALTARAIKTDLSRVVQGLVQSKKFTENKHDNLNKTTVLQRQMRSGHQVREDFENVQGALWGYARRKFSIRAIISFELFRSAQKVLPAGIFNQNDDGGTPTVISIGGGPANDMFGYLLFQKHCNKVMMEKQSRLHVLDFAPGWAPIVSRVSELSGHDIGFQLCDLSVSLNNDSNDFLKNELLPSKAPLVVLLCYVLSEVMGAHGQVPPLLQQLLAVAKNAVFLFREPHPQALRNLLAQYPQWQKDRDYWQLNDDGLVVWQRN